MHASTADVNGTTLTYVDIGRGVPLLCLHGGMGIDARSLLVPGLLALVDHGVRLIVPDQRGHGRSSRGSDAEYTHDTWARDAHALASHLGLGRLALLGHSYGGFLALEYAVRWPESLTHLVLVGTSAGPLGVRAQPVASDDEARQRFRAAWPHFFSGGEKHWDLFDALSFSAAPYNAAFTRELSRYDLRDRVASMTVPALLIVGRGDRYVVDMEWLADAMPNATLHVIEGAGHLPFVEAPTEFSERVAAFLKSD